MQPETIAVGLVWYLVFLLSTTCHEAAHALAARLGGDPTAFHGGQATLNPWPHIRREPVGTVAAPLLSYLLSGWMLGWASAPYDPWWQQRYPRRAALMALAGPAANFSLVLAAAAAIRVGMSLGYLRPPDAVTFARVTELAQSTGPSFAATFLSILFVLNLLLGTFNLLPVPPLDGHTGITLLLPKDRARKFLDWLQSRELGLMGLLLAWVLFDKIFGAVFGLALNLLYPGRGYH